jgi:hypothetical protein
MTAGKPKENSTGRAYTYTPSSMMENDTDGVGSVRVITDEGGDVVERHDYLPFGEECRKPGRRCYTGAMNAVKAKVINGRFVIDEPTDLPEGTELYLLPVSEEDEDRLDIEAAHQALADAEAKGEKPVPWSQVKAELGL